MTKTERTKLIESIAFELAEFHNTYGERAEPYSRSQCFNQLKRRVGVDAANKLCSSIFVNRVEHRIAYWQRELIAHAS